MCPAFSAKGLYSAASARFDTTGTPWIGIADNYKAINAAAQMDAPDSIRSFYKTSLREPSVDKSV